MYYIVFIDTVHILETTTNILDIPNSYRSMEEALKAIEEFENSTYSKFSVYKTDGCFNQKGK